MELILNNGDYIPDGRGGVARVEGDNALLQRVLFRLTARRGMLPMLPNLGSQLYLLGREKADARLSAAQQYAAEAVKPEGLQVKDLSLEPEGNGKMHLTLWLEGDGTALTVSVTV